MKMMLNLRLLGFILFITGTYALYDSNSDVVELTPNNFERLVSKSDEVWIVEFFAPWCGHCKNLVPEYSKAARALKGIAKVGAVDADNFKELAQKYGVTGFPTVKIFTGSKHTPYQGQRTAEAFVDSALKAAKDKAYENLGKKAKSSDKKTMKKIYGHSIHWKKRERIEAKQIDTPQITLSLRKIRYNAIQEYLFRRRMSSNERPKLIKINRSLKKKIK